MKKKLFHRTFKLVLYDSRIFRMWVGILARIIVLASLQKTLYHDCFSPPRIKMVINDGNWAANAVLLNGLEIIMVPTALMISDKSQFLQPTYTCRVRVTSIPPYDQSSPCRADGPVKPNGITWFPIVNSIWHALYEFSYVWKYRIYAKVVVRGIWIMDLNSKCFQVVICSTDVCISLLNWKFV